MQNPFPPWGTTYSFISYSSKDKDVADKLCAALEGVGIRCWIAPRDLRAGTDWGDAVIAAILGGRVMALVLSENAQASPQVRNEVNQAGATAYAPGPPPRDPTKADSGEFGSTELAEVGRAVNADPKQHPGLVQLAARGTANAECVAPRPAPAYNLTHFGAARLNNRSDRGGPRGRIGAGSGPRKARLASQPIPGRRDVRAADGHGLSRRAYRRLDRSYAPGPRR